MRCGAWWLTAFLAVGCSRPSPGGVASRDVASESLNPAWRDTSNSAVTPALLAEQILSATLAKADPIDWHTPISLLQWQEAEARLRALPPERWRDPLVRFARARVAAELANWTQVAEPLQDLENQLTELSAEIVELRLKAQAHAGPYLEAARAYALRPDAASQLEAARAFRKQADLNSALSAATQAVKLAKAGSSLAAQVRYFRAELFVERGEPALAAGDYRAVALSAPTSFLDAPDKLAAVSPKDALSCRERYERALAFAKLGDVEHCERELELAAAAKKLPGDASKPLSPAERAHAKGWAWYMSRKDDARAAALLEEAAARGSKDALRDRFYAARAWARADFDDRAAERYAALAREQPRSSFGEQASYFGARLDYIRGRFAKAQLGYQNYLNRYGSGGAHVAEANYERALASLLAGNAPLAAKLLGKLVQAAGDDRRVERYRELEALALSQAGSRALAQQKFEQVIQNRPLSFEALASAAHLRALTGHTPEGPAPPGSTELVALASASASASASVSTPAPSVTAAIGLAPAPTALAPELPVKVKLLMSLGLDSDAEAALRTYEQTLRREHGSRSGEALCASYAALSVAARRYVIGQDVASWQELNRAPRPERRWLWQCVYPEPYAPLVAHFETALDLPKKLIYAVMRQESGFRPAVVSPANAVGLMQLIPPTAARVAAELGLQYAPELLTSPPYNIQLGSRYLRTLLDTFGHPAPAVAAYNAGPRAVSRWLESTDMLSVDLFVARIPYAETRDYVYRVLGNLARYTYLESYFEAGSTQLPELELTLPRGRRASADAY